MIRGDFDSLGTWRRNAIAVGDDHGVSSDSRFYAAEEEIVLAAASN
jgi:hypothetical protein